MKKICFFSSDSRPLYKRDIFRALSYPKNFVIHFRYQPKDVGIDLKTAAGQKASIFLTAGNVLGGSSNTHNNVHIREATILSFEETNDTGLLHFYLKLGDFVDVSLPDIEKTKLPEKFVGEMDVITGNNAVNWHELINSIRKSFPKELFYQFKLVDKETKKDLPIEYDAVDKQSFYQLNDENSYYLQMSFFDTEENNSNEYHSIRINTMNEQLIKVFTPETVKIEARRDNRIFNLVTKSLSTSSTFTYLNFETIQEIPDADGGKSSLASVDTTLKIEIVKNTSRILHFAIWSTVAAIAIGYAKILSDSIKLDGSFDCLLTLQLIIAAILGFASAFNLYKIFDKK